MNKVYIIKQESLKLVSICILILLSACTNNLPVIENDIPGEQVELKFSIGTRNAIQDENLKSPLEWKMNTVRIYAFNGDKFDCMKYFNVPVEDQTQGFFTSSMIVQSNYNKTLIAIINEPQSAKDFLDNAKTIAELKSLDYLILEYVDGNSTIIRESGLPMYGELHINLSPTVTDDNSPTEVSISVERAVVRVDIYMRSEAENTKLVKLDSQFEIVLQNSATRGYFIPNFMQNELREEISLNPLDAEKDLTMTSVPIISYYVPERGFVTGKPMKLKLNNVSVGGVLNSYDPLVIGVADDGTTYDETTHGDAYKIKRNHIYQMTVTVSNTTKLPVEIAVIPWNVNEDNSDLMPATVKFISVSENLENSVIAKEGGPWNGTFTFDNPAGIPFEVQAFIGENTSTPLMEIHSSEGEENVRTINTTIPAAPDGLQPQTISFWYRYYGKWFDTGIRQKRITLKTVRILMAGKTAFGTDFPFLSNKPIHLASPLGTSGYVGGTSTTAGFGAFLENNPTVFSTSGNSIMCCNFEYYTLNNGTQDVPALVNGKNVKQLLEENKIDILCLFYDFDPSQATVDLVLEWLRENPNRGLVFTSEYTNSLDTNGPGANDKILTDLRVDKFGSAGGDKFLPLLDNSPYTQNEIFKSIVITGPCGDIRNTEYSLADGQYGWMELESAVKAGFSPLLQDNKGKVTIAIHPDERILFIGDVECFSHSTLIIGGNDVRGPYRALQGNLWTWFIDWVGKEK